MISPHPDLERAPLFREAYRVACAPDDLATHRLLTEYLKELTPAELGA